VELIVCAIVPVTDFFILKKDLAVTDGLEAAP